MQYVCTGTISCFGFQWEIYFHRFFTQPGMSSVVSAKLWTSSTVKYVFVFLHLADTNIWQCGILAISMPKSKWLYVFFFIQVPRAIVNLVELLNIVPLRDLHKDNTLGCPTWFVRSLIFFLMMCSTNRLIKNLPNLYLPLIIVFQNDLPLHTKTCRWIIWTPEGHWLQ